MSNAFAAAKDDFQAGLKAYRAKQYEQAIRAFEHARQQGMQSSALYYNLAVSYYQISDYQQAKRWFTRASQYKNIKYLSEYNLGLVALKLDDRTSALQHFRHVAKNAKQTNLVKLANYQISQLSQRPLKRWSAYAQVEYGHDDNVTSAASESATKTASNYTDLYAYGSLLLAGTNKTGLLVNAYILDTKYKAISTENMQLKDLGLRQSFMLGNWQNAVSIDYLKSTLGGQDFQNTSIYEMRTRYRLSSESDFRLRYRYYNVDSLSPYTELTGTMQRLRLEYRRSPGNDRFKAYYEYETNDRSETTLSSSSYSPTRHTLRTAYSYAFTDKLELIGDLAYRRSDYPAVASASARQETRIKAKLELDYYLNSSWFLAAAYSHTNNDSDVASYRYKRNVSSVSINALF